MISTNANTSTAHFLTIPIWNGIVITNALHEILSESKRLKTWMHQIGKNGIPRTVDFQLNRSVGRLRNTHSYSDTIIIIKEMLKEDGLEGKYSNILDQFDCFPESFFISLLVVQKIYSYIMILFEKQLNLAYHSTI